MRARACVAKPENHIFMRDELWYRGGSLNVLFSGGWFKSDGTVRNDGRSLRSAIAVGPSRL